MRSKLNSAGVQIFRTDESGTIIATSDGSTIKFDKKAAPIKQQAPPVITENNHGIHTYDSSISTVVQNYATAYYQNVTDKMFLLDVNQTNKVYQNGTTLGTSYYLGQPTQKAVDNSEYKNSTILAIGNNWWYWLRSPCTYFNYPDAVRYVCSDGHIIDNSAYLNNLGVRPAFYINLSSFIFKCGNGTIGTPYVVK